MNACDPPADLLHGAAHVGRALSLYALQNNVTVQPIIVDAGRLVIRNWRQGDEQSLARSANNRKIWLNLRDSFPHPYTLEDALQWIRLRSQEQPQTHFAIVVGGEAVGGIGLRMQDDIHKRSAEIGFWLGEEHWGQGIMTDAVKAVADHAFRHLDVCRIYALVFEHNAASARVLEKSGFVSEARLRKGATKNGTTFDELLYALVR